MGPDGKNEDRKKKILGWKKEFDILNQFMYPT